MEVHLIDSMGSDLHYLGGLIDADGHIGLHRNGEGRHVPSLSFVNTDYDLIKLFQKYLKGHIYIKPRPNPNHAVTYEIIVRQNTDFLESAKLIAPYLRIKKIKLKCAIDYAELIKTQKNCNLSEEDRQKRLIIAQKWKTLKNGM